MAGRDIEKTIKSPEGNLVAQIMVQNGDLIIRAYQPAQNSVVEVERRRETEVG